MTTPEVSREDLMAELKRDLDAGKPLANVAYTVRAAKPMDKEEFSYTRAELKLTQAQLAEVLDISIKTVQAYEQGIGNVPGLVAKIMRLMAADSVFKGIFIGEMTKEDYSKYISGVRYMNFNNTKDDMMQFAQALMDKANGLADPETQTQIEVLAGTRTFDVADDDNQK